ncbi:MAG TPA: DUF4271 domain-containing protein [Bacteroidia bacterium]|nr:DUF4271 domain-containing protein [Bacteroidia bacterium]
MPGHNTSKDSTNLSSGPSFFSGHELPAKTLLDRKSREKGYDGFFSIILVLAFILFVIVKVFSPRKLNQMFIAFIKPAAMKQLLREEYAFSNRSSILLILIFLIIFPLFAFQAGGHFIKSFSLFGLSHSQAVETYLLILVFVFATYMIKIAGIRFLSSSMGLRSEGSEYIYTILLFNKVAGLVVFPLVLLIAFARQLNSVYTLWVGLIFLSMLLVYRIFRLIQIGFSTAGASVFYLFLYLCTLEILPFIVLIKLFMYHFS